MMEGKSLIVNDKPTWLARSTVSKDTSIPRFKLGSITGIYRVSEEEIELDMLSLNGHWERVNQDHLSPTYDIFPTTIPTT